MAKKKKKLLSSVVNGTKDILNEAFNESIKRDVRTIAENTIGKKKYDSIKSNFKTNKADKTSNVSNNATQNKVATVLNKSMTLKEANKNYKQKETILNKAREEVNKDTFNKVKKEGFSNDPKKTFEKKEFLNSKKEDINKESQAQKNAKAYEKGTKKVDKKKKVKAAKAENEMALANYYKNKAEIENEKVTNYDKTLGTFTRGAAKTLNAFNTGRTDYYYDENGKKIFLPGKGELKQEKVSNSYNTGVGKLLGDAGYNIGRMVSATGIDALTAGVGGKAMYWTDMAKDNYTNAYNTTQDTKRALANTAISTGAEFATGKLLGGATGKLTGGSTKSLSNIVGRGVNTITKSPTLAKIAGNAVAEGAEEGIQEYIDKFNNKLTLGSKEKVFTKETFKQALYSAGIGALTGGILGENLDLTNENDIDTAARVIVDSIDTKNMSKFEINNITNEIKSEIRNNEYNKIKQTNDVIQQVQKGKMSYEEGNNLLSQIQNGTYEQNQNLQRTAQEAANQIINNPNMDQAEKTRQMNALNQTLAQQQQAINQNTLLDQQNNANNTDYRGSHQIEQAKPITDLSLDNIRNKLVELDGYLTKQTESDLKTLEKIFNNPNEDVKIYRASPVNELNSGDWVTTDKSYAQEVANNNGGKVYEYTVKPSQLNYPDNVRELPSLHRASSFQVNMDNNSNIEYNQTNRGDINEKIRNDTRTNNGRNNPVYDSETKKMGETISKREYSKREYERFENAIKTNESKSITKRQSEIRNKINNTTGKNVVFFDGNQTYKGGSSLNDRNSIYVSSNLSEAEQNFVVWHEVMESEILHNKNFKSKYANNAIDEILNDPNFDKVKENFIDGDESLKNVSDRLIAKDILCDIYAEQKSGEKVSYDNMLSKNTQNVINYTLERANEVMKGTSNSSFSNDNIAERKSDEVITAKQQTQKLNDAIKNPFEKVRQEQGNPVRSWVKTATTETGTTELVNSMDGKKITYEPTSNKKNKTRGKQLLQGLDYNDQVKTVQGWLRSNNRVTSEQVAATEILLQDAIKRGDAQTTMELIEDASIMATEAGQTIQALSLIKNASPTGQLEMLQKIIQREQLKGNKSYDGVEIKENLVKDVLDSYNEDGTYNQQEFDKSMDALKQDIADQMKVTPFQKLNNWRYLSMLGNPKTHIRNIIANVAMQITSGTKNKIGAVGEALVSPFAKDMTRTKTLKKASQEISDFSREYTDTYFETNETRNKYTDTNQKGLKGDIESRIKAFGDKWFGARAMSKLSDWNTKALDVEDVVFNKSTVYRTFKNALTANGLTTKIDIENNPELVNTCFEYAVQQGKEATFHQDSKLSNVLSNAKSKLRDKNSSVLDKGIGLATEATIPFVKTPVNIAKTGVEYTPGLGMLTTIDNFRKAPNNMKAATLIDGLSKQFTGGILAAIGYELVKKGVLKGATGEDKKDELEKELGFQGYSLKIGDNTYDLSWLSPSAMPLFVGAEMYGMSKKKNLRQADIENAFFSTIDPLTEMSFISSVQSALQSYSQGGKQLGDMLKSMGKSYVTQYIPTLLSQLANATDDKQRSTRGDGFTDELKKQVMYKVPGLRQKLDANTDVWGNDKKNAENIYQRAFESFLSPANRKTTNIDATTKELERVYDSTGSGLPNTKLQRNQLGEKLTSSEYAQFKKTYGKTAKSNLDQLVKSDAYKNADDDEKEKMISAIYKYSTHKAKEQYADKNNIEYTPTTKSYALVDAFDIPMSEYSTVNFSNIKADVDASGKTISNSRKKKIVQAIQNMDLTAYQKAVLFKKEYPSYKGSDKEIINYIQNSSLSLEEKYELAKYLKFKVK